MKKNNNKAYLKPTIEIVYVTECSNILAGSGEMSPAIGLDGRTDEPDAM